MFHLGDDKYITRNIQTAIDNGDEFKELVLFILRSHNMQYIAKFRSIVKEHFREQLNTVDKLAILV